MYLITIALTFLTIFAPILQASKDTSQAFMLRTALRSQHSSNAAQEPSDKSRFENLWLTLHPTGAGFYDAIFTRNENSAYALNGTLDNAVANNYYSGVAFNPSHNFYFHNNGGGDDVHYLLDMKINRDFGAA